MNAQKTKIEVEGTIWDFLEAADLREIAERTRDLNEKAILVHGEADLFKYVDVLCNWAEWYTHQRELEVMLEE
jgi:hypothetical protein